MRETLLFDPRPHLWPLGGSVLRQWSEKNGVIQWLRDLGYWAERMRNTDLGPGIYQKSPVCKIKIWVNTRRYGGEYLSIKILTQHIDTDSQGEGKFWAWHKVLRERLKGAMTKQPLPRQRNREGGYVGCGARGFGGERGALHSCKKMFELEIKVSRIKPKKIYWGSNCPNHKTVH